MEIREVNSTGLERMFLDMVEPLYKKDPNWVRPLDIDLQHVFDRKKNRFFKNGDARRWLLFHDNKCIGRVAAFYKNPSTSEQNIGGMGFFECINDQKAAFLLFDQCTSYLKDLGFDGMDGPINFGERDRWWGLMVDGFFTPVYGSLYTHKYYQNFFEAYGFKTYFEQYYFHYPISKPVPEKFNIKADRIRANPLYTASHLDPKRIDDFTEDFRTVYNDSWAIYPGMKPMSERQSKSIMKSLKPIMDPKIMWFAYYDNNPIAFFIMIPDYNPVFAKFHGKLNAWTKLMFLYHKHFTKIKRVFGVIFGVHPDHQGKGVEGFIIRSSADVVQPMKKYEDLEMTWIGDFNPKMLKVVEGLGATRYRTFITYRKLFDPTAEFIRMPIVE